MNCYNHDREFVDITRNDDGTYERHCDCGFHETIVDERESSNC